MPFLFRSSSRQSDRTLYSTDAAPKSTKSKIPSDRRNSQCSSVNTIGEATIIGQKIPDTGLQYGSATLAQFKDINTSIMFL
ncbi:hypothetical protein FBU59_002904 [Linderina macrospora]|uniref:Uncharacterized protein n=1 Tax=Linderina macrospora TaxID=4868 RepID=A0ACC1J9V7_9FUNG|nr:hypothetical protein FBU59_002904 [Linderina macrospora]